MFPTSQTVMGGIPKVNRKIEEWTVKCIQLVHSAHRALSALVVNLDAGDDGALQEPPGLKYPQLPDGQPLDQVASQFEDQCQALTHLLSTPFQGPVRFPLGVILKLITRCLSISYKDVTALPSLRDLAAILPGVQQSALDVLLYLVLCCGTNLLPQSRLILDLLQQVLTSSERMESAEKSELRSSVYRIVAAWLKMAGLGHHFQSQLNHFVQVIVSDVQFTYNAHQKMNGFEMPEAPALDSSNSKVSGKSKKKKKKNRMADLYKDLLEQSEGGGDGASRECKTYEAELTLSALNLSKVILERGQFLQSQKLVRCILESVSELQRCGCPPASPYATAACRLKLYEVVWCCSQIALDNGANTSDVVAHFQTSNQALSLLAWASHGDSFVEVTNLCQELLSVMCSYKSLQKPIVRRVLPDDSVEHDMTEVSRQVERLTDENESLRKRMLELEMERHNQKRVTAALNEELAELKSSKILRKDKQIEEPIAEHSEDEEDITCSKPKKAKIYIPGESSFEGDLDSDKGLSFVEDDDESEEDNSNKEEQDLDHSDTDKGDSGKEDMEHESLLTDSAGPGQSGASDSITQSSVGKTTNKERVQKQDDVSDGIVGKLGKENKKDDSESDDVQEMLMDFVDADPDN